ncbi:zinc finger, CCHC-type containing protein, partial [Tanacetum coccineum]
MLMEDFDDELKDLSDDAIFEAGDDMHDPFPLPADEESQPLPSTEKPYIESQPVEPISTKHQSPSLAKDHLESSKEKKHKKSNQSPGRSDSRSSSCFETFKTYDNYVPVTERVLARNLQGFSEIITQFKTDHIEGINKILTNFKEVQDAVKEDLALNKKVLEAAEAYTKNSSTLLKLLNLATIQSDLASLNSDTGEIKAIMTKIFSAFKGQPFSDPLRCVPEPTLSIDECVEMASQFSLTPSKLEHDDIKIFGDAVTVADLKNPIEGDYSRPTHEGYRNTIELLDGNNVVPLRSDTIQLVQNFFPRGRTTKLRNDILMFQQHHGESLSEAWTRFKDLLQKFPHHGIDLWLHVQIFYDLVNLATSWNDPRDLAKQVKAISLPQDVPSTSDHHLIEQEN